ncbi:MAG: PHP domain-containing protein [Candidatus Micrarchaeia archaeon]
MKIDFHVHTKHSPDSFSDPKRLVKAARRKGLDAIAVTDHNSFDGVEEVKKAAKKIAPNLLVIGGTEFLTDKGEVLGLFLKKPLKSKPGERFEKVCREIRGQKGLVAIPHPFDSFRSSRIRLEKLPLKLLKSVDAIEVYNSRVMNWKSNERALVFASEHGLAAIAGSDAHFLFELGTSCTYVFAKNENELKKAIKKGESAVHGKRSKTRPLLVHGFTMAGKRAKKHLRF